MSTTLLTEQQRQKLRDLSRVREDKDYPVRPNEPLEAYITELREQYPEAFLDKDSLKNRVFMDEPRFIHNAKFIRAYGKSPIHIVPVKS
jgi:hypothetical protein